MVSLFAIALLTACPPPVGKEDPETEVRQQLIDELDANLRDRSLWRSLPGVVDGSRRPSAGSAPTPWCASQPAIKRRR